MRRRFALLSIFLLYTVFGCGTLEQALRIDSITPSAGSTKGGDEVTIAGQSFGSGASVTFGTRTAPQTSATNTHIVVTSPSNSDETGSVDVTVTTADGGSVTRVGGFTYVSMLSSANRDSTDIGLFDVDRSGQSMAAYSNSPFGAQGTAPRGMDVDTTNGYLFVTNGNSASVSVFTYSQADGTIAAVSDSPFATNSVGPISIALDVPLRLAFVANTTSDTVSAFTYDADTGAMTLVGNTSTGATGIEPADVAIDTTLRLIFVSNATSDTISVFSYDQQGDLTENANSPFAVPGQAPIGLAIDISRRLLFAALADSDRVAIKSYDGDGDLTDVHNFIPGGTEPYDIILGTQPRFVFIANRSDNTIGSFQYAVDGSSVTATGLASDSGGTQPVALAIDTDHGTLFVANSGSNDIQIMSYDAAGALAKVGSAVASGGQSPFGLAFIP